MMQRQHQTIVLGSQFAVRLCLLVLTFDQETFPLQGDMLVELAINGIASTIVHAWLENLSGGDSQTPAEHWIEQRSEKIFWFLR